MHEIRSKLSVVELHKQSPCTSAAACSLFTSISFRDMIIADHSAGHETDHTNEPDDWTNHVNYMDFIPNELILKILLCMTPDERLVLERVNRRLRSLTIALVQDFSLLPSLQKLQCHHRRMAILKYGNMRHLAIKDSDVLHDDFAQQLAHHCPLIEEFHVVSTYGLAFLIAYVNSLPSKHCAIKKLAIDMRFDAPGAIELIAGIVQLSPKFEETIFFYPTRDSSRDLISCQQMFSSAGMQRSRVSVCIIPVKIIPVRKE